MSFFTNLVPGKEEKEKHIRKVQKSEERKVKNIEKNTIDFLFEIIPTNRVIKPY